MNAKRPRPPDDWGRGLIEHCKQPFDSEGSGLRSWGEQEADAANRSVLLIGWGYEQLHYNRVAQKRNWESGTAARSASAGRLARMLPLHADRLQQSDS